MNKKEIEQYLKIIYITSYYHYAQKEALFSNILRKSQEEISKDLIQLSKDGYIRIIDSYLLLTDKGLEIVKRLYRKNKLFDYFFDYFMRMNYKESYKSNKLSNILKYISSEDFASKVKDLSKFKKIVPLTFLKSGEKARFVKICGGRGIIRRLNELGIVRDVEIIVKKDASIHGPIKISVRNSDIILGYGQAKKILVEVLNNRII